MPSPYKEDVAHFCVTFTRAVIAWNNAEEAARKLLLALSGGGIGAQAAITHLGNVSLLEALATVVSQGTPEEAEHLSHFIDGMGILRAYRNFYVHSLKGIGQMPGEKNVFVGSLYATDAKKRLRFVNQTVTSAELTTFMRHVGDLNRYGSDLQNVFAHQKAQASALAPPPKPLSSIQKPTWPAELKKLHRYLIGRSPLPESSPQ